MNGNGYVSLAEVDRMVTVLDLEDLRGAKPVLIRAFEASKGAKKSKAKLGADFVEKREFRTLLVNLRCYLELYAMFSEIDSSDDGRIDFAEFERTVPLLESWGAEIDDPREAFDKIDSDGAGMLLFNEFAMWAVAAAPDGSGLDLEDDDENEAPPVQPLMQPARRPSSPRTHTPRKAAVPLSPRRASSPVPSMQQPPPSPRRASSPVPRCATTPRRAESPRRGNESPRRAESPRRRGAEAEEGFAVGAALYDELTARELPLPANRRYQPSRRVLLAVFDATHGSGCILQQRSGGIVGSEQRGKILSDLWRKLTADETTSPHEILVEAQAAHKRHNNVRTPSPSFKRWLSAAPGKVGGGGAGFGSTSDRLHPVDRAGLTDSTLAAPGVGAYNPQQIESGKNKGSAWSVKSTFSRLKTGSAGADGTGKNERDLPWVQAEQDQSPGMGLYRTSSRDMAKQIMKDRKPSPGMAVPTSVSRLKDVKAQMRQPGPGSYDSGGFNLSRRDHSRPSSAFKSATPRSDPFAPAGGKSPMLAGGMAALDGLGSAPKSPHSRGRGL